MTTDLHTKYRPEELDLMVGHDDQIIALATAIDKRLTHAFLFTGPAGVGKTTLARITAKELGCDDVREVDAATHTGIDSMREVTASLPYRAFGGGSKAVIVDECHRLSAAAWASILKALEEPPEHVYWMLCTTDVGKVPKTIKSRCVEISLKALKPDQLLGLLEDISEVEELDVHKPILEYIARNSDGSARQALVNLSLCCSASSLEEAANLLRKAEESDSILELCRLIVSPQGRTWEKAMRVLENIEDEPESVRIVVLQYLSKVAASAKSDEAAAEALRLMSEFAVPFNPSDKRAPLILALGEVILNG